MLRENLQRLLENQSSMPRVHSALNSGLDPVFCRGLAELNVFGMRVPESQWWFDRFERRSECPLVAGCIDPPADSSPMKFGR
jgi:hypothetical protein